MNGLILFLWIFLPFTFGPLNLGNSPQEARDIAIATMEKLGLLGFEDKITYKLLSGEKRLVSLATVLAMDPEVLLLDEPTNGLDEETEEKITEILKGLNLSCVFISHNLDFLLETADRIYAMAHRKIAMNEELVSLPTSIPTDSAASPISMHHKSVN